MVVAFLLLRADLRRRGISGDVESLVALPCLAGIAGAKLYHVFESPRELFADPFGQIFSQFGFAWFGGLIAGTGVFLLMAWKLARSNTSGGRPTSLLEILDAGSPAVALGYGIGRIGCLVSGDGDYGIPTSLPWGMSFPDGLVPTTQRVHPTPIYELIVACVIAWWLWRLGGRALGSAGKSGIVFAEYLVWTGIARFLVEFIRINPRSFLGLTNAQAASLASVAAGGALWWLVSRRAGISSTAADH